MKSSTLAHEMQDFAPLLNASPARDSEEDGVEAPSKRRTHNVKEKYSLRERQKRRHALASVVESQKHSKHKDASTSSTNSNQRHTATSSGATTSSKTKAPPLSKYRRKTANARERTRMREINSAFENLRHCVPQSIAAEDTSGPTNEKLTKITTLRLAMKYIRLLTEVLKNPNFKGELPLEYLYTSASTNTNNSYNNNNNYSVSNSNSGSSSSRGSVKQTASKSLAKPTKAQIKMAASALTKALPKTPKRLTTKRKSKVATAAAVPSESIIAPAPANSSYSTCCSGDSLSSNSSHFLDSVLSTESNNTYSSSIADGIIPFPSITELTALALESDGESLHLSEHCHSPLQDKYTGAELLFSASELCTKPRSETEHGFNSEELEAPLELNLQFLGATPESLDFSLEQPPTSCISPLVTLDAFNPFGDFLQEYPDQSSLDLFLT